MVTIKAGALFWGARDSLGWPKDFQITRWDAKPNPYNPLAPRLSLTLENGAIVKSSNSEHWQVIKEFQNMQRGNPYSTAHVTKSPMPDPFYKFGKNVKRGDFFQTHNAKTKEIQKVYLENYLPKTDEFVVRPARESSVNRSVLLGDTVRITSAELARMSCCTISNNMRILFENPEVGCEDQYDLLVM